MSSNIATGLGDGDAATLAEVLATVERTHAQIASAQAELTRALARAGDIARAQTPRTAAPGRAHDMALRSVAAEIASALRLSDRTIQRHISEAVVLVEDYPATLDAWQSASISRGHVRVIVESGDPLPPADRRRFETEALARCADRTPGRLRAELELLAERMHPRTAADRHRDARAERRVRVVPLADGMSDLCATLPTVLADAIHDRLTRQARAVTDARGGGAMGRGPGENRDVLPIPAGEIDGTMHDDRTMDQIRADVLADMLLTAAPTADPTRTDDGPGTLGAIRAKVQIVVPALVLLGTDDGPADLVGRSPIDPASARALPIASPSPWERVMTDPVSGAVLHVDTYQRTTAIDRHLRARDRHCRFPGCRLAAVRCEVDHTVDAALGGATRVENLAHLCQRHHSMKQFTAWRVRQCGDGVLEWTSPLGRVYRDEPPSLGVHFLPTGAVGDPVLDDSRCDDAPF